MRTSGILMPIFSLASPYGIGTLGKESYEFVDFLCKAGQTYWQILPINPTNFGDSPYQSFSSAAGNPYLIDLDELAKQGLLLPEEYRMVDFGQDPKKVDYAKLYENRLPVLRLAYRRFCQRPRDDFEAFCQRERDWLEDYALFMALKDSFMGKSWHEWPESVRLCRPSALKQAREVLAENIEFYRFLQYLFFSQWFALKDYANQKGIRIIGDMPIYVADDSADVWSHSEQFALDEERRPVMVAGCPPDAFSPDGQLWGMPVYHWEAMASEKRPYSWWRARVKRALKVYDVLRIDHFRGFESYYCVKYGAKTARRGSWKKGPGMALFSALQKDIGHRPPIIAEDLGFLTPAVKKLLEETGFPGMKVLQFAFDSREESDYLPHCYPNNCVVYTGTHDNNTIKGWSETAAAEDVAFARRYMHVDDAEGINWAMMRTALMSVADTAILMMPDIMGLSEEGRINTPSTVGGNWQWRLTPGCVNDWLAGIVRENTALYGRLNPATVDTLKQ